MKSIVEILKGKEMHTNVRGGYYHDIWEYKDKELEARIEDDKYYTVKSDFEEIDGGGIAGDFARERHIVLAVEETPPGINFFVQEQKRYGDLIWDYKYKFLKEHR